MPTKDPVKLKAKLARYNKEAKTIKLRLMLKRGNKCEWPQCNARTNLTFDHVHGRDYALEGLTMLAKYRRYEQEDRRGGIRLLCTHHNSSDGAIKGNKGYRTNYGMENKMKRKIKKIKRVQEFLQK